MFKLFEKILNKNKGRIAGYDPLRKGYQPTKDGRNKIPPKGGSGIVRKGGIGENISLKEVNINIGKPGQIIITGRKDV